MEKKKKRAEIFFDTCDDCPYYEEHGFILIRHVCTNPKLNNSKIIQSDKVDNSKSYELNFELLSRPIDIPSWCPLEDKK